MNKWIRNKFLFIYQYLGKWISKYINQRPRKTESPYKILLYCNAPAMEEHLLNYMEQTEEMDFAFYIVFGGRYKKGIKNPIEQTLFRGKDIKVLRHNWQLFVQWWDLIVCADLELPFWMFKGIIPTLYIGHGISTVSYDNGKTVYDYGPDCCDNDGELLFDRMLEPNRRVAELMKEKDKRFYKAIRYTGYRFAGKIEKESQKGKLYRRGLGIDDKKTVVSFFGSWNRESLFHVLGEGLFSVCESLKDKYAFIFSIHPIEYNVYNKEIKPMGALVESQREKGFIVRSPGEDWMPYIMASDIVVSDYSTMMSLALLAGKKVILSDFPDKKIGRYSLGYQVKKTFPVLKHADELEKVLNKISCTPEFDQMVERFRSELYVSADDYKKTICSITEELLSERTRCRDH